MSTFFIQFYIMSSSVSLAFFISAKSHLYCALYAFVSLSIFASVVFVIVRNNSAIISLNTSDRS